VLRWSNPEVRIKMRVGWGKQETLFGREATLKAEMGDNIKMDLTGMVIRMGSPHALIALPES
jgi:hypothetical protein